MSVIINSLEEIQNKLGINEGGPVMAYAINRAYAYMDKYVPMDKGNLRTIVDINGSSITYQSPYARRQYYGKGNGVPFDNYTTAGTGPYWDKQMVTAEGQDLCDEIGKIIGGRQ